MATKRKTTTAIVAGVTAAALLLGGTFAWTSISQTAKNETAGIVNVGGRLHDDFNGTNKDVYVENFTDPLNGGQPIYARVRLDEYMEVGKDAGGIDVDGDNIIDAVPVISGTDRKDVTTWKPHVPESACETCTSGDTCVIHDHWTWLMGGVEGNGSTTFMPTFNKDKDSLAADINGTYGGTDKNDKIYYDDYVEYTTTLEDGVNNNIAYDDKEAYEGKIYSIIGTEIYDDDTDTEDNGGTRQVANVTHTAKQTATATVVTMDYWVNTLSSAPGNYWVYDTDGWAYWANPIMPGEATGLLLDGIDMKKNPGEKCYYAINVVAQFATVGDWEYFDGTEENGVFDGTDAAKELLETVSKNVTTVTVVNNGATTLSTVVDEEAGTTNTTNFTATAAKVGDSTATVADAEFTWAVYDADLNPVTTSTITQDGVLTIGKNEQNKNLIIAATHTESGAVGLASVAVVPVSEVVITAFDGDELDTYKLSTEHTETFTVTVQDSEAEGGTIEWSVADGNGNPLTETTITSEDDNTSATLNIGAAETTAQIVVTVTYTSSSGKEYSVVHRILSATFATTDDLNVAPYVVFTDDGNDTDTETTYAMYFVRTEEITAENVTSHSIAGQSLAEAYLGTDTWYEQSTTPDWLGDDNSRDDVTVAAFINKMQPTAAAYWFFHMTELENVIALKELDTSKCTSLAGLFGGCKGLTSLDVSTFDTSNVTDMSDLFSSLQLEEIKGLENFDTSNVTSMWNMFSFSDKLVSLDLSGWDVSNVEQFDQMFSGCESLNLNCSDWNVKAEASHSEFNSQAPGVILPTAWQTAE